MSYTFTITCNTVEEMERLMAAMRHDVDPAVTQQVQAAVAEVAGNTNQADLPTQKARRGRPPKAATEPAAPASQDASVPDDSAVEATDEQTEPAQQPEPAKAEKLTIDDARNALRALQSRKGEADMAAALAVLGQFGANRISEVKAEDYAAFITACENA